MLTVIAAQFLILKNHTVVGKKSKQSSLTLSRHSNHPSCNVTAHSVQRDSRLNSHILKEGVRRPYTLSLYMHLKSHLRQNHNCNNVPASHALGSSVFSGWPGDKQGYNDAEMRHSCILHSSLRPAELMGGLADCSADDEWFYTCRWNITSRLQRPKYPQPHACCCGAGLHTARDSKAV